MRWLINLLLLTLTGLVQSLSTSGTRLLAVLEDSSEKPLYSTFWKDLEGTIVCFLVVAHLLTHAIGQIEAFSLHSSRQSQKSSHCFAWDKGPMTTLFSYPQSRKVCFNSYLLVVIACLTSYTGLGPSLTPKLLLDFINAEGNILLGLSANSQTPAAISSLLLELDIHLPSDRSSVVVDHFSHDISSSSEKHDVLLLPRPQAIRPDVKNYFGEGGTLVIPHAVGQSLGASSPLLAPILSARDTAYSYNPKDEVDTVEDPTFATGTQISLISSMQARNSARFTILGSVDMLQNKWFDATVKPAVESDWTTKTVNREFAKQLTQWTFKETGVLKVQKTSHYLSSESEDTRTDTSQLGFLNPDIYRIKNDVVSNP